VYIGQEFSCTQEQTESHVLLSKKEYVFTPHENLLGILRVSNPVTRKDLADRTWGSSGFNPKQLLVQT